MTKCANCKIENATIGTDSGAILCTKCADILMILFRGRKWKMKKLKERRELVAQAQK